MKEIGEIFAINHRLWEERGDVLWGTMAIPSAFGVVGLEMITDR